MSEFPTPIHDLPLGVGGRLLILVVLFIAVIWGLLTLFVPNYTVGYGTTIFVGSLSIVLAVIVNRIWDNFTDKEDED